MSYATEKKQVGRRPVTFVEMDLDFCQNTYGVLPCTATGGAGVECYNTRKTCQDPPNYNPAAKTYRFVDSAVGVPASIDAIPSLRGVSLAPTTLDPGRTMGVRASITITFDDHPHGDDGGVDPYRLNRSYDPLSQGTFWGKLQARNPYYQGRIIRVRSGYLTDPFDWNNFEDRTYVIERIDGPNSRGQVKVTAKDVLKLADDERAKVPVASTGKLAVDLALAETGSMTLGAGQGAQYGAAGDVRIGGEIIQFAARSGDVLSTLTRSAWGTTAKLHKANAAVQLCKSWAGVNVVDVISELLTDAGVPAAFIPTTDWNNEKSIWLSLHNVTAIISRPTGVKTLLTELIEENQINLWWDERVQQVKLKASVPPFIGEGIAALDDEVHFVGGSVTAKDDPARRISQVWVYYSKADHTNDDEDNYQEVYIASDSLAEGVDQYDSERVKVIKSRWFAASNSGQAIVLGSRLLKLYRDNPKVLNFALDAKDSANWTGDLIDVVTQRMQGDSGAAKKTRMRVISVREKVPGSRFDYVAMSAPFEGKFGFIGPDFLPDYSAALQDDLDRYAWISLDTGLFGNGDEAYKIS